VPLGAVLVLCWYGEVSLGGILIRLTGKPLHPVLQPSNDLCTINTRQDCVIELLRREEMLVDLQRILVWACRRRLVLTKEATSLLLIVAAMGFP